MILRYDSQTDRYVGYDSDDDDVLYFDLKAPVFVVDGKYYCIWTELGNVM